MYLDTFEDWIESLEIAPVIDLHLIPHQQSYLIGLEQRLLKEVSNKRINHKPVRKIKLD